MDIKTDAKKRFVLDVDEDLHRDIRILAGLDRVRVRKLTDEAIEKYVEKRFSESETLRALREEYKETNDARK